MPHTNTAPAINLTNCDQEPIHKLGRVQAYGALLAVNADWTVVQASANLEQIFGVPADSALGKRLDSFIAKDALAQMRDGLATLDVPDNSLRFFNVPLKTKDTSFDVSLHRSGDLLVLEFEPKSARNQRDIMSEVYPHFDRLHRTGGVDDLAQGAALGLQQLTGFDSVMVYKFQPDHSGQVLAEVRRDGEQRYLGLFFPASDVPAQARALYKRSLLRLISDVADTGAAILSSDPGTAEPLDLSLAVTRAVSPIHIEYLRNMGVQASMSVSIMKDGELWGMFACHHDTPRYIDYERRTAVEMFGHIFSYELSRFETEQRAQEEQDFNRLQTKVMAMLADGRPFQDSLRAISADIQTVVPHDGMVLYSNGSYHNIGTTLAEAETHELVQVLDKTEIHDIFATNQLETLHRPARAYADICAGLIAIPISKQPGEYLLLCRRSVTQTVKWAGNPVKPVNVGPNGLRLHPRKSFEAWKETVEWRSAPWEDVTLNAANLLRTVLLEVFLKVTEAANAERARAQEQQQLLIAELNHRVRNILNLMRGLVSQTKVSARNLSDFTSNLDGRIHSLARAHDQLTKERWEPASLRILLDYELDAYAGTRSRRIVVNGPDVQITPEAYTTLALVLHELTTNSVKHGALSNAEGRVTIHIQPTADNGLQLDWVERGGPIVIAPRRRGFGSTIVEHSIPHELGGTAAVQYNPAGLEARFRIPAKYLAEFEFLGSRLIKLDPQSDGCQFDHRQEIA